MAPVKINEGIYWVGEVDWDIRDFHGLTTSVGSTYNSYLVVDEKTALIDAVSKGGSTMLLRRISEIIDPSSIDYVISNHAEPDHSGALNSVMEAAPGARLLASKNGIRRLDDMYHAGWEMKAVDDGEEIFLGRKSLQFHNAPLLHWPETMFTYCPEARTIFSCDLFGAHIAGTSRFVDRLGAAYVLQHTRKYYAFLMASFRTSVLSAMKKMEPLEIDIIAPSHGPVWRDDLSPLLDSYEEWANLNLLPKATIVYGTMWGGTGSMVDAVADGLKEGGLDCTAWNVVSTDPSDIIADLFDSSLVLIASPTFVSGIFPPVEAFIPFLRVPRDKSKKVACFGSYGWGGGAVRRLVEILKAEGYDVMDEQLAQQFFPGNEELKECYEFGRGAAEWALSTGK